MKQSNNSLSAILTSLVLVVFAAFMVVGAAIPVLPLHVHGTLGMSTFVVGLVSGAQFTASLLSRLWSGRFADRRGGKRSVIIGLQVAVIAGLLYLASLAVLERPGLSVALLLCGRAVLGGAESFIITGALSWALTVAGPTYTGRVMAWVGMAMYVAFAIGGPLGSALYAWNGFAAVAIVTMVVPACAWFAVLRLQDPTTPEAVGQPTSQRAVLRAVWLPGVGLALSSFGFGTLATFAPLLLAQNSWGATWSAFSAFSLAFVFARLAFGHLPDRVGGVQVAIVCVLIEGAGQWLVWYAGGLTAILFGSTLTGLGYSLVYPALGVEAVRRVPPQSRALAMGTYTAFLDLTLGIGSPVLGLLAGHAGVQTVFLVGAATAVCSALAAFLLRMNGQQRRATAE